MAPNHGAGIVTIIAARVKMEWVASGVPSQILSPTFPSALESSGSGRQIGSWHQAVCCRLSVWFESERLQASPTLQVTAAGVSQPLEWQDVTAESWYPLKILTIPCGNFRILRMFSMP